jgi:hypothetical protein
LKHVPGRYNPTLSGGKKNTKIEQELGAEILTSHLLLCETSKLRNEISKSILATFTH